MTAVGSSEPRAGVGNGLRLIVTLWEGVIPESRMVDCRTGSVCVIPWCNGGRLESAALRLSLQHLKW